MWNRWGLQCVVISPLNVRLCAAPMPALHTHRAPRPKRAAASAGSAAPQPSPPGASQSGRYRQPRTRIPPEQWAAVVADTERLSLRQTAERWQVSHEAIRQIVRRVQAVSPE